VAAALATGSGRRMLGAAGLILGRSVRTFAGFLLFEPRCFGSKLHAQMPDPERAHRLRAVLGRISRQIEGYVWVKTLTSLLTGVVSFVIMWAVGVDFAEFWALVIFLLNFIPIIGAMLGVIFPSLLAMVQFETIGPFLVVSSALAATQFVVGNLIEPRLMGRQLNLSPLVIILSLAFWGALWGVVGMILCIPIAVIIMIVCGHFEPTRPVAIMLSADGAVPEFAAMTEHDSTA
jgi:predicted PurR-regulated permease PerM